MMMMTMPLSATTITPYPSVEFPLPYPVDTNTTATQNNTNNTIANTETPIPTWSTTPYADTFTPNSSVTNTNVIDSSSTTPLFNNTTPLPTTSFPNTEPSIQAWFNTVPVVNSPLDATNPTTVTQTTVALPTTTTSPYTPAFTATPEQSTTPENTPPAWFGKHPTATLLGIGAGGVGGGIIGGTINHLATNTADNTNKNPDSIQYTYFANPGFEPNSENYFYPDKTTPRRIRDTTEKLQYNISENQVIQEIRHYSGGRVGDIYTYTTDKPTIQALGNIDMTVEVGNNNLVTLTHHKDNNISTAPQGPNRIKTRTTYQLTDKGNGVRLYKHSETPIVNNKNTVAKLKQQFLIHNSGIAVELNAKGDIIRILDMNATIAPKTAPTAKELADALKDQLIRFEESVLSQQQKDAFIAKTNRFIAKANGTLPTINRLFGTPQHPKTAFMELDKHLQTLLLELKNTSLETPSARKKVYNITELLQASGVKLIPKEAEKKAVTDFGEIITKAVPGILLGGAIGSAIVFGADYWLQHRKTSVSGSVTAAP
jgi:hypothetical protein